MGLRQKKSITLTSLSVKYMLAACLTSLLAAFVTVSVVWFYAESSAHKMNRSAAIRMAESLRITFTDIYILEALRKKEMQSYYSSTVKNLLRINQENLLSLSLYNRNGKLVAGHNQTNDFKNDLELLKNHRDSIVFLELDESTYWVNVPLIGAGTFLGTVAFQYSGQEAKSVQEALVDRVLLIGLLFVGVSVLISAFLGKRLVRPIHKLATAMSQIGPGEYKIPELEIRHDEIELLHKQFVKLLQRMQKAEKESKDAQQKLLQSEKLAAVGSLTAGIAHEINNPITGMESCLARLVLHLDGNEKALRYFNPVQNGVVHIKKVVEGLLDYTRPRSYDKKQSCCDKIIQQSIEFCEYKASLKHLQIERDANIKIRGVWDCTAIKQVLVNLIMNAIDASPVGGIILIGVLCQRKQVHILVTDQGTGIPGEIRERIFDPFFTTKSAGTGTGLGLSLSQKIIEDHDGRIFVSSSSSEGTVFEIWLPGDCECGSF